MPLYGHDRLARKVRVRGVAGLVDRPTRWSSGSSERAAAYQVAPVAFVEANVFIVDQRASLRRAGADDPHLSQPPRRRPSNRAQPESTKQATARDAPA